MAEKFIRCWHPEVEGEALFAEASVPHQMKKGWAPVEPDPVEEPKPKSKSEAKRIEVQSKPKVKKTESLDK